VQLLLQNENPIRDAKTRKGVTSLTCLFQGEENDYLKRNCLVLNVSKMAFDTSEARNDRSLKDPLQFAKLLLRKYTSFFGEK